MKDELDNYNISDYYFYGKGLTYKEKFETDGTSKKEYYFYDRLGNVVMLLDEDANVLERNKLDPFGNTIMRNSKTDNKRLFIGKERDYETRLDYFEARYMANDLGRFISPDLAAPTLTATQSFNRYVYCKNNPMKYIDLDGLKSKYISSYENINNEVRDFTLGVAYGFTTSAIHDLSHPIEALEEYSENLTMMLLYWADSQSTRISGGYSAFTGEQVTQYDVYKEWFGELPVDKFLSADTFSKGEMIGSSLWKIARDTAITAAILYTVSAMSTNPTYRLQYNYTKGGELKSIQQLQYVIQKGEYLKMPGCGRIEYIQLKPHSNYVLGQKIPIGTPHLHIHGQSNVIPLSTTTARSTLAFLRGGI